MACLLQNYFQVVCFNKLVFYDKYFGIHAPVIFTGDKIGGITDSIKCSAAKMTCILVPLFVSINILPLISRVIPFINSIPSEVGSASLYLEVIPIPLSATVSSILFPERFSEMLISPFLFFGKAYLKAFVTA